jgi:hypothetical protein
MNAFMSCIKMVKVILLVFIYIDDAATVSKDIHQIKWFKHSIQEFFPIKDLGELRHILSIQVTHNHQAWTITLNEMACKTQPPSQPHSLLVAIYPTNNLLPHLKNEHHMRSM